MEVAEGKIMEENDPVVVDSEAFVLWEWENDFGWWLPYEPPVGACLEKKFSTYRLEPNNDSVPLGVVQESLSRYEIEFRFVNR